MSRVAPFTGAWIEILMLSLILSIKNESHPSRVRGLKFGDSLNQHILCLVAPFTGAWIEISHACSMAPREAGRTLHGCVD